MAPSSSICDSKMGRPLSDLLAARFTTARRVSRVIGTQALLLSLRVDTQQEDALEQVDHLVNIEGNATNEYRHLVLPHNLLEPRPPPHPVVCPEPLLIRLRRAIRFEDLCARIVLPIRQFRVVVGINRDKPTTGKLSGERRLS